MPVPQPAAKTGKAVNPAAFVLMGLGGAGLVTGGVFAWQTGVAKIASSASGLATRFDLAELHQAMGKGI